MAARPFGVPKRDASAVPTPGGGFPTGRLAGRGPGQAGCRPSVRSESALARTLVFPAGMPRSIEFARNALAEGDDVVGASSLPHDPAAPTYPAWAFLPFITDDRFEDALAETVERLGITRLYTPNPVVWRHLSDLLPRRCPKVRLLGGPPVDREMAPYRNAFAFADDVHQSPLPVAGRGHDAPSMFPRAALAATFKHVDGLPGMCDHEKIRALFAVFESVPEGDIVEIGSWWGKSALLLHRLARLRGTGPTLCIDPWAQENLPQGDAKGLVDSTTVSTDEAFEVFVTNLSPYAEGHLNYLRMPSDDALAHYGTGVEIRSPAFGSTRYTVSPPTEN